MSGSDNSMTAHAYAVIMSPHAASVMEKLPAMSTRSPTGMNSEVFKMNAENIMPTRGSH